MIRHFNPTKPLPAALLGAAAMFVASWLPVAAQDDPFGAPAADAPKAAADPFGAGPEDADADAGKERMTGAKPAPPLVARGPEPAAVLQIRESNPTTPSQLVSAAETTLAFGRPDEAKRYLAQLIAAKPDPEALAPLATEFAGPTLIRFASDPQVQPEGKQVAEAILASAQKVARDPARILALVPQFADADPAVRAAAFGRLQDAGVHAVPPLLTVLANPKQASVHRGVRDAITSLGRSAEGALIGALQAPDDALRAQVILVLGRLRSTRASVYIVQAALDPNATPAVRDAARASLEAIWGKKPTRYEAERVLLREYEQLSGGRTSYEPDADGLIELWYWDPATNSPKPSRLAVEDAARMLADRVTLELVRLAPDRPDYLKLRILAGLDWARTAAGRNGPLPRGAGTIYDTAVQAGPEMVSDTLADALLQGKVAAALGAIEVFAETGRPYMLNTPGADAALAKAMLHPDQRVRVAAALAVVKLRPEAFAGASRVTETLANAISTRGVRRLMVAHPRLGEAQDIIASFGEQGFEGDAYLTGQALLKAAVTDPDVEMIIVSDAIDRPPVHELVQVLRKDYRTAGIPIAIMAASDSLDRTRFLTKDDPRTIVIPRITGPEATAFAIEQLSQRIATPIEYGAIASSAIETAATGEVPPLLSPGTGFQQRDERMARAIEAIEALTSLAGNKTEFNRYELLRAEQAAIGALAVPGLTPHAAQLLALIATPKAQTALLEFASQPARPLEDRKAAAAAFASAVDVRGVLLTTNQIRNQYDLYNASEALDQNTQAVLGSLLDAIEAKRTTGAAIGTP